MSNSAPLAELGEFIVKFQLLESLVSQLIEDIVQPDPDYVRALTAELEFTAKTRALDVIFSRFAQIHGVSQHAPHDDFHKLMTRIAKLAERRNELVHSFYGVLLTLDERIALLRMPTRLRPSKGEIRQAEEELMSEHLAQDVEKIHGLLDDLSRFRALIVDTLSPEE